MTKPIFAAAAASMLFALPAFAQEEAPAPDTYTLAEDGTATHKETGAVCPGSIADMTMAQVLTFDTTDKHLGITCQYISANGFSATISVVRIDEPGLVGPGDSGQRWNNSLYQILGAYPAALPANRAGLEGDAATGMRGALFTANGSGLPVRLGSWQLEDGAWQYRAQVTYVATSAETEWDLARQTREALVAAKSAADAS